MDATPLARAERLAVERHGLLTLKEATASGMSRAAVRHQLDTGRWIQVRRQVLRLVGAAITPRSWLLAAVLDAHRGAVASHASAAALHGLPGFMVLPAHITVEHWTRPEPQGVVLHRSRRVPAHHRIDRDAIPCTSIARTLFDLCGSEHPARAARALDHALARRLVTFRAFQATVEAHAARGRDGSARARQLVDERAPTYVAPESGAERKLMELLDRLGIPQPERQVDLGDDDWIGRVDFLFRRERLVVEVDGAPFHDSVTDRQSDDARDARLARAGFRVLRIPSDDLSRTPADVGRRLKHVLGRNSAAGTAR